MNKNITTYKVAISIIFGLLGFAVNFYSVDFVFYSSNRMSFLFGLLFPMLIRLSWGWKNNLVEFAPEFAADLIDLIEQNRK
ncbi:MAG: hypothetical protein DRH21_00230 [Deltaproteobacteria bacterium]|nr:MAG: hypothetical protein DRH21_00230 [Deltaproteobacteria bacterium]